ncbi:F-box/LRR-repeat protein At3g03360 [Linum grandiflorum]
MPEAIRTSVLSRRWTHLWKSAVSVLDFDGLEELEPLYRMQRPVKTLAKKRIWFMNWVNRVVSQMQQTSTCSRLTKFRIYFNLTRKSNSEGDIDRWLEFAISKRLESLHLELNVEIRDCVKNYVFPKECWHHIKTPAGLHDIRSLRSLRLSYVDVGGEILEHFIANCPVLEELAVKSSSRLKNLKVVGSSHSPLPLKHLEVRFCRFLASLEVDHTPRLERLIYVGHATPMEIRVGNCPSLVDMTLGYSFITNEAFTSLSSYATRLVSLVWKVNHVSR